MYCRRCGAALHQGVVICPECGARQRRGLSAVRCARCSGRVPLGLTVCPHCGRDVHAAGPRWGLWIAGLLVVALAALWGLGALPIEEVADKVSSIETQVAGIIKVFGPSAGSPAEASPTPQAVARASAAASPTRPAYPTKEATATIAPTVDVTATVALTSTAAITSTAAMTSTAAITATLAPATPTFTPTLEPTATPTATETPTPVPTETPTSPPTATPIPGRTTYKVKSGDTLSSIADQFGISWQDLASANGLNSRSTLRVGQELIVPLPGGSQAPAPTASQGATTYTVKSGDSLSSIAQRYGITWQELAQANGLTASSRLSVGQKLIIPGTGGSSQAAPTATPAPVARATATPTEAPLVQVPAPVLVSPSDQTPYSGASAFIELVWEQSADLPPGAQYQVLIRWNENGVLMEYGEARTTGKSIRFPTWLYGKADQPARQYTWSVRVAQSVTDGQGGQKDLLLSPASSTRVLYWN